MQMEKIFTFAGEHGQAVSSVGRGDSPLHSHSESFGHAQNKLREESFFCRESAHLEN